MAPHKEIILETQHRCAMILECRDQIKYWQAKLEVLEEEQSTCIKLAKLRLNAAETWSLLNRDEQLDKRFILAAFESNLLPKALKTFPNSSFPPHIRLDREILLARLSRPDFSRYIEELEKSQGDGNDAITAARSLFIPNRLKGDKEVVMAVLRFYPQVIETMSAELRDDEQILQILLTYHGDRNLPNNFLQHFSERIRSCPNLMFETIVQYPMGLTALGSCSSQLRNDKSFILSILESVRSKPYGNRFPILRYVSQRLRADRDVVLQAVQQSGLNLKHASYDLRRDKEIITIASFENVEAFRYCLSGPAKDELLQDRDFVLQVISRSASVCSTDFHSDREFQLNAAIHDLDWTSISPEFMQETDFVRAVLREAPGRYMDLPACLQEEFEIALEVILSPNVDDNTILEATEQCPKVLQSREAMQAIVSREKTEILEETLQFSPACIRADKEIMLPAVMIDAGAFDYCSEELQADRDIVLAAVPEALVHVADRYQMENPDIVVAAIEKTHRSNLWMTFSDICSEMWSYRDVAMAWIAKGGEWLEDFPWEFCEDEEFMLLVAKHRWVDFEEASDLLLDNKEFLKKAVALDGRIIGELPDPWRQDHDLALIAFSGNVQSLQTYARGADFDFMVEFGRTIRNRIEEHRTFHKEVVQKINSSHMNQKLTSRLGLLNQGPEVASFYVSKLESFLGLPDRETLRILEQASENLLAWGM